MKKFLALLFVTTLTFGLGPVASAAYDKDHDHHEHHESAAAHEEHVGAIREAIELLEKSHSDLIERLEKVAEHHENL